jgi:hypothetical protein
MSKPIITSILFFATILIGGHLMAEQTSPTRSYSATAYSLDSDELLYVERHFERWQDGRLALRAVTYEDADGNLIAEKQVRYGDEAATPSFEMIDLRTGLVESAQVGQEQVELFSGLPADEADAKSVALPKTPVIDAGFDAFMRENFETIARGERLEFDFAVPAHGRFIRFQLEPQGELVFNGSKAIRVTMKPANVLLRLLVDPIDLTYSVEGRLLQFKGISNVVDREGDRYKARIVFDYAGAAPIPAS